MLRTFVLAAAALWCFQAQAQSTAPLKLYWHGDRGDNFTTATAVGQRSAVEAGYAFARDEGVAFASEVPGTIPLKLYWHGDRSDNLTIASPESEAAAIADGYVFARIEGYVYPNEQSGTVPLKLFYSDRRGDYFTTASAAGEQAARGAGYDFVRIEGYVFPAVQAITEMTAPSAPRPIYIGRAKPVDRISPSQAVTPLQTATEALKAPPPSEPPTVPNAGTDGMKWKLPEGVFPLAQNNRWVVQLYDMVQSGTNISGRARATGPGDDSPLGGKMWGMADGTILADAFEITIFWGAGKTVAVYRGTVNQRGRVEGVTFDRANPGATTPFYSSYLLVPSQ